MRLPIMITFMDVSTPKFTKLDSWDNITGVGELAKFEPMPIPNKGDLITIANKDLDCAENIYKVTQVQYNYKHFDTPEMIMTYITVNVKKV